MLATAETEDRAKLSMTGKLPSLVIVGRPNVGKSTLFNRLTGSRRSIVTDEPGITRDRIYGRGTWGRRSFEVVDTGGMLPEDKAAIPREIVRQADVAISGATVLVLVADARAGLMPLDAELARRLRRTGKPLVVVANKVDTRGNTALASAFYELGADVFPVSAEHGTGVDDLLDALMLHFPQDAETGETEPAPSRLDEEADGEIQVAIIGRPNVGKSTLLNVLAGAERAIVSPEAGTTRDAVDTEVLRGGKSYRFIDTAGIRRKGKTNLLAEKLSVIMARKHLERADVALVVADAAAGISAGDATIAGYAHESGRSVIVVMNKWDLALQKAREAAETARKDKQEKGGARGKRGMENWSGQRGKERKAGRGQRDAVRNVSADPARLAEDYELLIRDRLKFLPYAPIIYLSALTGDRVEKLYALIDRVAAARRRRISTGELNRWLAGVDLDRGTSPSARRVKIFYVTQAASSPPTFILFTNQKERLHFSYERFLENQLREQFDFTGSPIRFIQRVKERGHRERARTAGKRRRAD
jgi:GTPase